MTADTYDDGSYSVWGAGVVHALVHRMVSLVVRSRGPVVVDI